MTAHSLAWIAVRTRAPLLFPLRTRDLPSLGADLPAIASFCTACAPSLTQLAATLTITHCSYPITPSTTVASQLTQKAHSSSSPPLTRRIEPRRFDGRAFFTWASFFISRPVVAPEAPHPFRLSCSITSIIILDPSLLRGPPSPTTAPSARSKLYSSSRRPHLHAPSPHCRDSLPPVLTARFLSAPAVHKSHNNRDQLNKSLHFAFTRSSTVKAHTPVKIQKLIYRSHVCITHHRSFLG